MAKIKPSVSIIFICSFCEQLSLWCILYVFVSLFSGGVGDSCEFVLVVGAGGRLVQKMLCYTRCSRVRDLLQSFASFIFFCMFGGLPKANVRAEFMRPLLALELLSLSGWLAGC